jgi:hypothetical protein
MVFTDVQEKGLVQYIQTVAKTWNGLTKKVVHELAFKFAGAKRRNTKKTGIKSIPIERDG